MQNFSEESFSVTPFLLGIAHPDKEEYARELHARFFPEGGRLLEGFLQNVVFQLTDDDGFPVTDASSYLLDEKNDTVARAVGVPSSGLGRFSFHPEPGRQYRLLSVYHGAGHTFPLQTQAEGATLQAVVGRGRWCAVFFPTSPEIVSVCSFTIRSRACRRFLSLRQKRWQFSTCPLTGKVSCRCS